MIQNASVEELMYFDADPKPQSLATATDLDSTTFLSVRGYRSFIGIGIGADITGDVTIQLLQALNSGGGSAKALGDSASETGAGETVEAVCYANEQDLDTAGGFYFVGVRISHDHGTNIDVAAVWGKVPYIKPVTTN